MTTQVNTNKAITFTLKNVEFHYVHLAQPITPTFADGQAGPQWSVQVRGIDQETAMDLKELGAAVSYHEETETFSTTLKQYTQTAKGKANELNVFDGNFEEIPMDTRETIGYGSKGHVAGYMYAYNNVSGTGVALRMTDVVITELVEKVEESKEDRMKRLFG